MLKALVLGAGKGTRLASDSEGIPKVLRRVCGKTMISYVLDNLSFLPKSDILIVAGYMKNSVMDLFPDYPIVEQKEQLGTGHAVMSAQKILEYHHGNVLVCYGDMPLIKRNSYRVLIDCHETEGNACTILSGRLEEQNALGRIKRCADGSFDAIVEAKDSTEEENKIREYNSGVYMFDCKILLSALGKLTNNNSQGEYYLTDVPSIIKNEGHKVGLCALNLANELIGVNTIDELLKVETILAAK